MENKFEKYLRLSTAKDYNDSLEAYQIILDSSLQLSKATQDAIPGKERNNLINDALILFQMSMTKGIAILSLANGINYYNSLGNFSLGDFVDPMSITSLVRSQYEAFANFHNIFNSTDNKDAQKFLYDVWVLAGLQERQRFYKEISPEEVKDRPIAVQKATEESNKKAKDEQKIIESLFDEIRSNPVYLEQDEVKRKKLDERIKKRTFQFRFDDGQIKGTDWLEMFLNTGAHDLFTPLYSMMSTSTHPSNVSVFQYAQIFDKYENLQSAKMLLRMSEKIMCFFIADFCLYLLQAKEEFQKLPEINRVIIETSNSYMRNGNSISSGTLDKFSSEMDSYMMEKHADLIERIKKDQNK